MALYMKEEMEKSDLQQRITDSLRDKHKNKPEDDRFVAKGATKQADLDGAFKHGTKQTSQLTAVWIVLLFAMLGISIWFIIISS